MFDAILTLIAESVVKPPQNKCRVFTTMVIFVCCSTIQQEIIYVEQLHNIIFRTKSYFVSAHVRWICMPGSLNPYL